MTDQQILEKAIQKAIDRGWKPLWPYTEKPYKGDKFNEWFVGDGTSVRAFIFNHDFAKALWGDNPITVAYFDIMPNNTNLYYWQYHLQQLAVADDVLKYLKENI